MSALLLAGCSSSRIDPRPVAELGSALAAPPSAISADCEAPVDLPDAAVSEGEVVRLWAADRIALMDCGDKHRAETDFYGKRDKGLAGK